MMLIKWLDFAPRVTFPLKSFAGFTHCRPRIFWNMTSALGEL